MPKLTHDRPSLTVLSLGWGQQSWALAAMSALGELPPVDIAIHADTGWERTPTREFAAYWTPWLEAHGIPVATVYPKDPRAFRPPAVMPPTFTVRTSDGKKGQSPRQCTRDWKTRPQKRLVRQIMRDRDIPLAAGVVEKWLGYTTDEDHRRNPPPVQYITHRYPLIELGLSRRDAITWLQNRGLGVPVKSSCIICPFRNNYTWHEIKTHQPADFRRAVQVDRDIRKRDPTHDLYLHPSCQPLDLAISNQPPLIPPEEP